MEKRTKIGEKIDLFVSHALRSAVPGGGGSPTARPAAAADRAGTNRGAEVEPFLSASFDAAAALMLHAHMRLLSFSQGVVTLCFKKRVRVLGHFLFIRAILQYSAYQIL